MDWPEQVIRVQSLSDAGITAILENYIKPPEERPSLVPPTPDAADDIPVVDLGGLDSDHLREATVAQVSEACRGGLFQLVNHGIRPELLDRAREVWYEFFHQPMEVKQAHANLPTTYEGYGSRLGVEKDAILDWIDYYYLHYLPCNLRDFNKWPSLPTSLRGVIVEYSREIVRLGGVLLKILSINLGLKEDRLQNEFGGEDIGACLRVNFYPKCPQPELTLGLSPHSDPGGITFLLTDADVAGLQIRRGGADDNNWITVKPAPHGIIVNIGDQIQVMTNGIYKSIEHRVIANSKEEGISLAYFYNPKSDLLIQPIKEVVASSNRPALYPPMTFDEYRLYIRTKGLKGKSQLLRQTSN